MNPYKALVVDDDEIWRKDILGEILAEEGFIVDGAGTAKKAIDLLAHHHYSLAVVDICLSQRNNMNREGLDVIKAIIEYSPYLPVVVISGFLDRNMIQALDELLVKKVFQKEAWDGEKFSQFARDAGPFLGELKPAARGQSEYFVGHGYTPEQIDDLRPRVEEALETLEVFPSYADQNWQPVFLLQKIHNMISSTRFSLFDLSSERPNVFIELGIAIGLKQPLVVMAKDGTSIPAALQDRVDIFYPSFRDLQENLAGCIRERIGTLEKNREGGQNFCLLYQQECDEARETGESSYLLASPEARLPGDFHTTVQNALTDQGLQPVYLGEGLGGIQFRLCVLCRQIQSCRFGLYHLHPGTPAEVYLALGMAIGMNKPYMLVVRQGTPLPSNLSGIEYLEYASLRKVETELAKRVQTLLKMG
jgi:CheY-like chemotaxis protein